MHEPALGLGWPRAENAQPPRARVFDTGKPERRLADPSVALEHERESTFVFAIEEGADGGQLLLATDDLQRHAVHRS